MSQGFFILQVLIILTLSGCRSDKQVAKDAAADAAKVEGKDAAINSVTEVVECTAEGQTDCRVDGKNFGVIKLSKLDPSVIKNGIKIAGIIGNLVPAPAECAQDGDKNCIAS